MGLLDPTLLRNLKGLTGLLAETPIGKYVRGKDQGLSVDGLRRGLLSIPVFENTPEANQTAYEAAMNIGPLGLGKIVYHGSPHKFDKFDASKIGTGEGAQAYGHGVYLADKQGIAQGYADTLSDTKGEVMYRGNVMRDIYGPEATLKRGILTGKSPGELAKEYAAARSHMKDLGESKDADFWNAASKAAKRIREEDIKVIKAEGQLYKADLPDEWIPKMLDWDKPLSQQPELRKILKSAAESAPDRFERRLLEKAAGDKADNFWGSGAEFYRSLMAAKAQNAPAHIPLDKAEDWIGQRGASMQLNQLGIPGIRYLDGGSRGKGQGSYNYVVFPGLEDQVKILERNGIPINDGLLGRK